MSRKRYFRSFCFLRNDFDAEQRRVSATAVSLKDTRARIAWVAHPVQEDPLGPLNQAESKATMIENDGVSVEKKAWPAIRRGLTCKCPNCGKGRLFHHYLEQVEYCASCKELLAYYKAGLFLPFVVVTIVIHILAFVMLHMELTGQGNPLVYLYTVVPLSIIFPLAILPSAKGGIVGLMWAMGWSDEQDR